MNDTEAVQSPIIASSPSSLEHSQESIFQIILLDTAISVLVVISMALCAWLVWQRHSLAREERDKLGHIMQDVFWNHEEKVNHLLDTINKLRQSILFREVTQLHILAYQFRIKNQVLTTNTDISIYSEINHVLHFFERIRIDLPLKGTCPKYVSDCVKHTVYKLGIGCIEFWNDSQVVILQAVVRYFCGSSAIEISSKWISDEELSSMIMTRTPYINQLQFDGSFFVLQEIKYDPNMKLDFCSKIRYIDVVLSRSEQSLQLKQKFLVTIYNNAREICLKSNFILQKSLLPDIPPNGQNEIVSIHDIVMYVRHLIRTMCMEKNLPVVHGDDKFCKLLLSLYEQLYGSPEPATQYELIERVKKNIISALNSMLTNPLALDLDSTRTKLEDVEKDLLRHIHFNRMRQDTKVRRRDLLAAHKHASAKSFESEASVYTMALSASAFALQRSQGTFDSDLVAAQNSHLFISPQHSLDAINAASSSMYDAMTSPVNPVGNAVSENTPLISNTPPTPVSTSPDRPLSPMSIDSDYYETAV